MSHLFAFRPEISRKVSIKFYPQGHTIHYLKPVALERPKFFRVIRHHACAPDAKIAEYLGALVVLPEIDLETEPLVCLDRVGALVLKLIRADLIYYTDASAFLLLIDYRSAAGLGDHFHSCAKLLTAFAFGRTENIARQTLRMYAEKRRFIRLEFAAG